MKQLKPFLIYREPDEDGTITWAQLETFFFGNDSRWNHAMSGKDPENGHHIDVNQFSFFKLGNGIY